MGLRTKVRVYSLESTQHHLGKAAVVSLSMGRCLLSLYLGWAAFPSFLRTSIGIKHILVTLLQDFLIISCPSFSSPTPKKTPSQAPSLSAWQQSCLQAAPCVFMWSKGKAFQSILTSAAQHIHFWGLGPSQAAAKAANRMDSPTQSKLGCRLRAQSQTLTHHHRHHHHPLPTPQAPTTAF